MFIQTRKRRDDCRVNTNQRHIYYKQFQLHTNQRRDIYYKLFQLVGKQPLARSGGTGQRPVGWAPVHFRTMPSMALSFWHSHKSFDAQLTRIKQQAQSKTNHLLENSAGLVTAKTANYFPSDILILTQLTNNIFCFNFLFLFSSSFKGNTGLKLLSRDRKKTGYDFNNSPLKQTCAVIW